MRVHLAKSIVLFFACTVFARCGPPARHNKYSDDTIARIADLQDKRLGDSLYRFLSHADEAYRREAALAFASVQDTAAAEPLGKLLLYDEDAQVRLNAAFALGQTGGDQSARLLIQASAGERDPLVMQTILESIGKVADVSQIQLSRYDGPGVPWLCYRLGLRQATSREFNTRVAGYLHASHHEMTRLGAAQFFAGSRTTDISDTERDLAAALRDDPSDEVRMAAASALRKIDSEVSLNALRTAAARDTDYRVRVNAVKALGNFPVLRTKDVLFESLHDTATNVSIAAAEVIQSVATDDLAREILREARASPNWRVQALLFQGVNWIQKSAALNEEIKDLYQSSGSQYRKAWLLSALNGPEALPFVVNELLTSGIPVIKSSAAAVIVAMNREEPVTPRLARDFLEVYKKGIATGDVAVIGLFTDALADTSLHYRDLVGDVAFLREARERLSLPRDYESVVPLENAIAFFEGRHPAPADNPYNHGIDWDVVRRIPVDQQAVVTTSKGAIVMTLHVEDAPGSVANFAELVRRGYFDGRVVHRVVPNFVIQDGCPRGDGWGSESYSIRSEFSLLRYAGGSVGMASAGKDTECTQWFITHSSPPRLDGRYTIFASVADGMDVVHRVEVGDTIHSIALSPPLVP